MRLTNNNKKSKESSTQPLKIYQLNLLQMKTNFHVKIVIGIVSLFTYEYFFQENKIFHTIRMKKKLMRKENGHCRNHLKAL